MTETKTDFTLDGISPDPVPLCENVSPETFKQVVQEQRQPVVLKGLLRSWPVIDAALKSPQTLAGLLQQHANQNLVSVKLRQPGSDGRYFYTEQMTSLNFALNQAPLNLVIEELLRQAENRPPMGIYMDAVPVETVLPGFSEQHAMPLVPPGTKPRIWLGNNTRVAPHFDQSENIACVVSGERQFLIFPPEQVENLYMGPIENTPGGAPVSMVDPRNPDLSKYPKYKDAISNAMLAKLEPGDAIYIPRFWWHYVEASGPFNVLVNYWWDTPDLSPLFSLVMATRSIRRLPSADRQALRAFFDHFAFSENAPHALDHIPESARGVMGADTRAHDDAVRSTLKQIFSDIIDG